MEPLGVVGADRLEHAERVGVLDAFGDRALGEAAGETDAAQVARDDAAQLSEPVPPEIEATLLRMVTDLGWSEED